MSSKHKENPFEFQSYFNEIQELSSSINLALCHKVRLANSMMNALARQGVERVPPRLGVIM